MLTEMYHSECYDESGNNVVGGCRHIYGKLDRQFVDMKLNGINSVGHRCNFLIIL